MNKGIVCLLFFTLCACLKTLNQEYKLSDEQFARVLFDLHYVDMILPDLTLDQRDSVRVIFWKRMQERYGMPEADIRNEISKLEKEPDKMKEILGRVKTMADSIQ